MRLRLGKTLVRSTLAVAALTCLSLPAKAGLLLEPYLGYGFGKFEQATAFGNSDADTTGTTLGARVGYTFPAFLWLGLDYSMLLSGEAKGDNSTSDIEGSSLYAVAGIDFPILLRAYIGYGFLHELKVKGTPESTYEGSAMKLGVGFTGLPIVSLNLEYIMADYDKVKGGGSDASIGSGNLITEAKSSTVMLSVSAPFDL